MAVNRFNIAAVGDVMIDRERPETSFSLVREVIQKAEFSFCQLETAYSDKGSQGSSGPRGAMRHDLRNYAAIPFGGFKVVSMASNHALDWGSDALLDCIARLRHDADLILGHHPHMLKGIEIYKGKVIFYSLGNFAFDSHPKAVDTVWYARRRKVYEGLLKVPPKDQRSAYHFQPESRYSMIANIAVEEKKIRQVSVLPVCIDDQAQPEPFSASDTKGQEVIGYLRQITEEASLNIPLEISSGDGYCALCA